MSESAITDRAVTDRLAAKLARPDLTPTRATERSLAIDTPLDDHTQGMSYLERLPKRLVTLYLPLSLILLVLLFPFYWMVLTSF